MSTNQPVISLNAVSKAFDTVMAVETASFEVQRGDVVGFVGANGAGKTTTISMIMGFLGVTSGEVQVFGQAVSTAKSYKAHERIGYASGDMELPAQLTAEQYFRFLLAQYDGDHHKTYKKLVKLFAPQLDKKIHSLSRGNKQKIALIAAFMTDPELIVLDEPTSGLDPHMQEVFLDLVRERSKAGMTIFMSSHYLQEVADVCDRVVLMKDGNIVQDIETKELLASGGKRVTIRTGYKSTMPPKDAESIEHSEEDGLYGLSFVHRGDVQAATDLARRCEATARYRGERVRPGDGVPRPI